MAIRFKFRSAVEFDSVQIEGNGIRISALKERILQQKNLGKGPNLDLVITNAETGEGMPSDISCLQYSLSGLFRFSYGRTHTLLTCQGTFVKKE
jgi:E3 ubiquitin-protein ligase RBBP6